MNNETITKFADAWTQGLYNMPADNGWPGLDSPPSKHEPAKAFVISDERTTEFWFREWGWNFEEYRKQLGLERGVSHHTYTLLITTDFIKKWLQGDTKGFLDAFHRAFPVIEASAGGEDSLRDHIRVTAAIRKDESAMRFYAWIKGKAGIYSQEHKKKQFERGYAKNVEWYISFYNTKWWTKDNDYCRYQLPTEEWQRRVSEAQSSMCQL